MAVLEGITFSQVDGLHALHVAGVNPVDMDLIGGGSRSAYWRQLLADALCLPILSRDGGDVGPALGAARLAQLADNQSSVAQVFTQSTLLQTNEPRLSRRDYLESQQYRYRKLYQLTRSLT